VAEIAADSAGERGGLQQGDVITALDGRPVDTANALRNQVADTTPGTRITLDVIRDGQRRQLSATLGEAPSSGAPPPAASNDAAERHQQALGITVTPVTAALARTQGLGTTHGLLVTAVADNSRAERSGLRPGDVIESVNRQPVRDAASFREALGQGAGRPVLLLVNRDGHAVFVTASRT
jgi:serine protease Do